MPAQRLRDAGYPYYVWLRGGERTPLPATMPVFSTEQMASELDPGYPFKMVEVDSATFYEILKSCHNVENVLLDMGTPNAVMHRIETLLVKFGPDSAKEG